MNNLKKVMANHRSIRKFKDESINEKLLTDILETSQWASTSNNLQAYSVIIVKDQEKKEALAAFSGNQQHVIDCPVFLVFCADLYRVNLSNKLENIQGNLDTIEPFIVATVDTSLYAQNVMLAAETLGLGGVFIGGIRNSPVEVSNLLGLPEYVYPVFGMCLGYPDQNHINEQKPRLPLEAVVHQEMYEGDKQIEMIRTYNNLMKEYYETRKSGKRNQTWTQSVADLYKTPKRIHLREFLESKNFGFK
ncbi:oxygen-insensitive NADPH nitroreductase [Alkalihalobacillus sp. BA299]|uniref:oxygen-insensitive NADPH nitroreductase n=1 Tax=Alkalihalobacillus sp. BA299 TaxID=2815938 RepID=UPI001ADB6384|nr:oxygen-insensitive NADPH nitroreductase [Alkalihalobacillus sp. BA299]